MTMEALIDAIEQKCTKLGWTRQDIAMRLTKFHMDTLKAVKEQQSNGTRSEIERALLPLSNNIKSLRKRIGTLDPASPLFGPLVATMYLNQLQRPAARRMHGPTRLVSGQFIEQIALLDQLLKTFDQAVETLFGYIDDYKNIEDEAGDRRKRWVTPKKARIEKGAEVAKMEEEIEQHVRHDVRKLLYPFLNKKDEVRPATPIMRLIKELYEDLFKTKFTFTYDEAKARTSAGHGADFTRLIIDEMQLGRYFDSELTIESDRSNPSRRGQKEARIADTLKNDKRRNLHPGVSKAGRRVNRQQSES